MRTPIIAHMLLMIARATPVAFTEDPMPQSSVPAALRECNRESAPAAPRTPHSSRRVLSAVPGHPTRWFRGTAAPDRPLRDGYGSLRLHRKPNAQQCEERELAAPCGKVPLRWPRPSKCFRPGRTTNGALPSRMPVPSSAIWSRSASAGSRRPVCRAARADRGARCGVPDAASQTGDVVDIIERTQQSERRS